MALYPRTWNSSEPANKYKYIQITKINIVEGKKRKLKIKAESFLILCFSWI
jgi:hypothetical protein